ncbi:1-(5-phosphoribosyl)-5-[(5-phosphoribosylamino)methylideneamino]imidazole-4-carboxamide isomerase [Halomonadaceae bacterium KBTZ08]
MLIIPAIDLKDGECVRLRQGRMEDSTVFSRDPVEVAGRWVEAGARRLHLVDLNGAFEGKPVNGDIINAIARHYPGLPIQIGGGIRSREVVEAYLDAGVQWVIIGTQAVREPDFVTAMCHAHPGRIIVGLDARDGMVATEGWAETSSVAATTLAQRFANDGVDAIVYTDIARDGMMEGVNVDATRRLAESTSIPVIASGGVSSMADVRALAGVADSGISGAITGRAIYEGTLDLAEAQRYCDSVASS